MPVTLNGDLMFHLLENLRQRSKSKLEIRKQMVKPELILKAETTKVELRGFRIGYLSAHDRDRLDLDHHLGARQCFDADERTCRIAVFLEKFFSQLSKARAVGHVGDKHRHGDDVFQFSTRSFEGFTHALERHAHLTVEVARISFSTVILITGMAGQVYCRAAGDLDRRRVGAFALTRVTFEIFS